MKVDEIIANSRLSKSGGIGHSSRVEAGLLHQIAQNVFKPRHVFLKQLAAKAQAICRGSSAGVSLLTHDEKGKKVLQWEGLTGTFVEMNGQKMPYANTPCGEAIERKKPLLFHLPDRFYPDFKEMSPRIIDLLIVPMFHNTTPLGTIWVVSQDPASLFLKKDMDLLTRISKFLASAIYLENLRQEAVEQKTRFQSVSESSPFGIFVADQNGRLHYSNRCCREMLRRLGKNQSAQNWHDLLPAETKELAARFWRRKVRASKEFNAEFLLKDSKKECVICVRGVPLGGRNATPLFLGTIEDITTRKAEEEALFRSDEFNRNILKTTPDCIKVLNEKGRLIFMNEVGMMLLQIRKLSDVKNAKWVNFWSGEFKRLAQQALQQAASGGEGRFQGPRATMKGVAKWWDVSVSRLPGPHGKAQYLVVSRDITQLKEQARDLSEAQEQLQKQASDLEAKVDARTADLQQANETLRLLTRKVVESHEVERKHLARELHDAFAQQLTGLKLILERECQSLTAEQAKGFEAAKNVVTGLMAQVRELSFDLRQSLPDHISLDAALEAHFRKMESNYGLKVTSRRSHHFQTKSLPRELKIAILRIIQEALTNVVRHAETDKAVVLMDLRKNRLKLQILDRGKGFDAKGNRAKCSGLAGMKERAMLLGGDFVIDARAGGGTRLQAEFPIQ